MPKLSYAQIAQKSRETSADLVNSTDYDELQMTTVKEAAPQMSSPASVEPRPPRSSVPAADSRPAHSHGRPRGGGGGSGHAATTDEMRHRDFNGVAPATRPLP